MVRPLLGAFSGSIVENPKASCIFGVSFFGSLQKISAKKTFSKIGPKSMIFDNEQKLSQK